VDIFLVFYLIFYLKVPRTLLWEPMISFTEIVIFNVYYVYIHQKVQPKLICYIKSYFTIIIIIILDISQTYRTRARCFGSHFLCRINISWTISESPTVVAEFFACFIHCFTIAISTCVIHVNFNQSVPDFSREITTQPLRSWNDLKITRIRYWYCICSLFKRESLIYVCSVWRKYSL